MLCFQITFARAQGDRQRCCPLCLKTYRGRNSATNLRSHLLKAHHVGNPYKCDCGKTFQWDSMFYNHRKLCRAAREDIKDHENNEDVNDQIQ